MRGPEAVPFDAPVAGIDDGGQFFGDLIEAAGKAGMHRPNDAVNERQSEGGEIPEPVGTVVAAAEDDMLVGAHDLERPTHAVIEAGVEMVPGDRRIAGIGIDAGAEIGACRLMFMAIP